MDKKKTIASMIFKFVERFSVKGIGLVISVILARLLKPEIFGQVAVVTIFINLSQVVIECGFPTALIQRKTVTDEDYSSVFWTSISLAIFCITLIQLISPWVAERFGDELELPLRVYSISLIVFAFNSLQISRMQKLMRFKTLMICTLIATMFSGVLGICFAFAGAGLWALIIYDMSVSVTLCTSILFADKWYPKFEFSVQRIKVLFGYGWKMFVSTILCRLYGNIRSLIIGFKFSNTDLGYYNRGQQFPQIISNAMDSSIQSVMFPTFASIQDEREIMRRMLKRAMTMGTYMIVPAMLGLAAASESVVKLLLTEKWLPCVPYMRWICLGEAAVPIVSAGLIAIKSSGRSDIYMILEFLRRFVMLGILMISVFVFGTVEAIAISFGLGYWVDALIISIPLKHLFNYGPIQQYRDIWKILLSAVIMFVVVFGLNCIALPVLAKLMVQIFIGIILYLILNAYLKTDVQVYTMKNIKTLFQK